ncbi:hypothetical protein L1887_48958 [Cichorium endivia]|nr:hypothetical protein L1887_48958 [Cichorium endivia]
MSPSSSLHSLGLSWSVSLRLRRGGYYSVAFGGKMWICTSGKLRARCGVVLLVGKDEQQAVSHFAVANDAVEFPGVPRPIRSRSCESTTKTRPWVPGVVVSPERSNLVLSSYVPDVELDVLVLHRLHVEAHRGDGGDGLVEFELVQDGGLALLRPDRA